MATYALFTSKSQTNKRILAMFRIGSEVRGLDFESAAGGERERKRATKVSRCMFGRDTLGMSKRRECLG